MIDLAAVPLLPLDVTIQLAPSHNLNSVRKGLQAWAAHGASLERLPGCLESLGISPGQVQISAGGSAANVLRAAQRWGCRTALAGAVGKDSAGEFIRSADTDAGLDLSLVERQSERATPIYLMLEREGAVETTALIPRNRRALSLFQAGNSIWSHCAEQLLNLSPRVVHINHANKKLLALVERLPAQTRISCKLDRLPRNRDGQAELVQLLGRTHLLVLSDRLVEDGFALLGLPGQLTFADPETRCAALLEALFSLSGKLQLGIVTRAASGQVAQTREGPILSMPACSRITMRDPTGAGDVFTGTLLAGLLAAGWDEGSVPDDIVPLLVRSSVAAALNCERLGAASHIPAPAKADEHIEQGAQDLTPKILRPAGVVARSPNPQGSQNTASLFTRLVAGIPAAVQSTLGHNNFQALIADFERTKSVVAIGSGSSYSVACALARLVAHALPAPYTATAYRPGEYLALGRRGETTICISQGGNPDIQAGAQHARNLGLQPFAITARQGRWLKSFAQDHVFLHAGEGTRSFVNARGPCSAIAMIIEWLAQQAGRPAPAYEDYLLQYEVAYEQVEHVLSPKPDSDTRFIALASGLMLAPLHEFELKAAEVGIDVESCYELKGWTHGRFQRAWKHRSDYRQAILTLETPADAPIVEGLVERFTRGSAADSFHFYRLHATGDALGLWQHFVHVMLLVERLATMDPSMLSVPAPLRGINRGLRLVVPVQSDRIRH